MLSPLHGSHTSLGMNRGQNAATNGLKQNLVAHWPMNAYGGNAGDAHAGLTMTAGPFKTRYGGYLPKPYGISMEFTTSRYLYRTAANSVPFQTGDKDFTICGWVYPFYVNATRVMFAKAASISSTEYALSHNELNGTARLLKFQYGNQHVIWGALTTWNAYMLVAWREKASNTINIQVNNGGVASASASEIAPVLNCGVAISKWGDEPTINFWDADMGAISIWISEPGAGGALSAARRMALWNNGAGMRYDQYEP